MLYELYKKMYEKMTKIRLSDERYKFETNQVSCIKAYNSKTCNQSVLKFEVCIF